MLTRPYARRSGEAEAKPLPDSAARDAAIGQYTLGLGSRRPRRYATTLYIAHGSNRLPFSLPPSLRAYNVGDGRVLVWQGSGVFPVHWAAYSPSATGYLGISIRIAAMYTPRTGRMLCAWPSLSLKFENLSPRWQTQASRRAAHRLSTPLLATYPRKTLPADECDA